MLGILVIATVSIGIAAYLLQPTPDPGLIIAVLVTVCLVLGLEQVILGYELQTMQTLGARRTTLVNLTQPRPTAVQPVEALPSPSEFSEGRRVPRPANFPRETLRSTLQAPLIGGGTARPLVREEPPESAETTESERRLERVRDSFRRGGLPDTDAPKPARKTRTVKAKLVQALAPYKPRNIFDPKQFKVAVVGRSEVVLMVAGTGEEFMFPADNSEVLNTAWRAFAKGVKVNPILSGGRIASLDSE